MGKTAKAHDSCKPFFGVPDRRSLLTFIWHDC